MEDRWSDADAARAVERWGAAHGPELALRIYSSRLLGAEPDLVLHGGGNTSFEGTARDLFGRDRAAVFVKASGRDLAAAAPEDFPAVDRELLVRLAAGAHDGEGVADRGDDDVRLRRALRTALLDPDAPTPSIEAAVHAVVPGRYVDHTHADAVLALTNRADGAEVVAAALGETVVVLPYVTPGLPLARAVAAAVADLPDAVRRSGAMVWLHHGLVTWGESAEESYRRTIELVDRAEAHLRGERRRGAAVAGGGAPPQRDAAPAAGGEADAAGSAPDPTALARWRRLAPRLRGLLAAPSGDADRPWRRVVLRWNGDAATRALVARPDVARLAAGGPLTADHLIRTKAEPLLVAAAAGGGASSAEPSAGGSPSSDAVSAGRTGLPWDDADRLDALLAAGVDGFAARYTAYVDRHRDRLPPGAEPFAAAPRVILLPGCGVAAGGESARDAAIALDVALHTLRVKAALADAGASYQGLAEDHLFAMEYRPLQLAKLARARRAAAVGGGLALPTVALVTGAAGAIGAGICRALLAAGAHVAATDLAGEALDSLAGELAAAHPGRVLAVPLDVTDADGADGVAAGFDRVAEAWGGVDLVVVNAGAAHVARIEDLALADFERLERVNVHGTLLVVRAAARLLRRQGTGGDVVLISTKNVFAPGAGFAAYSATKAAAHQIGRIASQELAADDVRVNMVAPDAVFGTGGRRSGLWREVGPERMKARGLDASGARGVLPPAQPAPGPGHRRPRRPRRRLAGRPPHPHHRRHPAGRRRAPRRHAALGKAGGCRGTCGVAAPAGVRAPSAGRCRPPCSRSSPR